MEMLVAFPLCVTPSRSYRTMAVRKALPTWAAVPENETESPLLAMPWTVKPWALSQPVAASSWVGEGPKRVPNWSGVSHWW